MKRGREDARPVPSLPVAVRVSWHGRDRLEPVSPVHPAHPARAWLVVAQPKADPDRWAFDPDSRAFTPTDEPSRLHRKGFDGVAGWLEGFGEPPGPHLEGLALTRADPAPGERLEVAVSGMHLRADGDATLLVVDVRSTPFHGVVDVFDLPLPIRFMLDGLFSGHGPDDGWFDGAAARVHVAQAHRRCVARRAGPWVWPQPEAWRPRAWDPRAWDGARAAGGAEDAEAGWPWRARGEP